MTQPGGNRGSGGPGRPGPGPGGGWPGAGATSPRPTPKLAVAHDDGTLSLSVLGGALDKDHLRKLVGRYVAAADIGKRGACHLFRHTMATLMHELAMATRLGAKRESSGRASRQPATMLREGGGDAHGRRPCGPPA